MQIKDLDKFYREDKREYDIKDNTDLFKRLNSRVQDGHNCNYRIENMQFLVNFIVIWYEMKYFNNQIMNEEDLRKKQIFKDTEIAKFLTFEELEKRVSPDELDLLKGYYRGPLIVYRHGAATNSEPVNLLKIPNENFKDDEEMKNIDILFDKVGKIENSDSVMLCLKNYLNHLDSNMSIESLFLECRLQNPAGINYMELKKCFFSHKKDVLLRNELFMCAALKMIYSRETKPEIGYMRALKFIEEVNEFYNINLSTDKLDDIMNKDYSLDIPNPKGISRMFRRFTPKMY